MANSGTCKRCKNNREVDKMVQVAGSRRKVKVTHPCPKCRKPEYNAWVLKQRHNTSGNGS